MRYAKRVTQRAKTSIHYTKESMNYKTTQSNESLTTVRFLKAAVKEENK